MKYLFIGLGCALAATAFVGFIAALCGRRPGKTGDEEDGGVVKRYWEDAPKAIQSTEIKTFHCEISLTAVYETDGLGHRVYTLDAVLKDGEVLVKYDWRERGGESDKAEYKADADFMVRLQEIVKTYDFAKHNGYFHTVSGLPDMYGESLDIVYESGERIHVHDNQNGFLSLEAEKALIMLFGAATRPEHE